MLVKGVCMQCGKPATTSYGYDCEEHEDRYGGDDPDD